MDSWNDIPVDLDVDARIQTTTRTKRRRVSPRIVLAYARVVSQAVVLGFFLGTLGLVAAEELGAPIHVIEQLRSPIRK